MELLLGRYGFSHTVGFGDLLLALQLLFTTRKLDGGELCRLALVYLDSLFNATELL